MKHATLWAAMAALSSAVYAAGEDRQDTIIITREKLDDRSLQTLDTPSFGVAVTADQIAAVNAFNVEDVFKYAPNLIVRKRYIGDNNATLAFRGGHTFQTPRALVSVDGFTISNFLGASFDTAPKWGVIAPGDVDRVEIVYGPTSARYSGHSLGGTLLLSTRAITENAVRLQAQAFQQHYDYYATDLTLDGYALDAGVDLLLGERGTLGLSYRAFENEGQPQQWRRTVGSADRQALIDAGVVPADYFDQAVRDEELTFLRIAAADSVVESREQQIRLRGTYDVGGGWTARGLAALLIDEETADDPRSFLSGSDGAPSFIGVAGVRQQTSHDTELLLGLGLVGALAGWDVDLALSRFDVLDAEDRRSNTFDTQTGAAPQAGTITQADDVAWNSVEAVAERAFDAHAVAAGVSYAGYSFDTPRFATEEWREGAPGVLQDASGGETHVLGVFVEDAITLNPQWLATLGLRAERWEARDGFLVNGDMRVDYASRSEGALSPKAALTFTPSDAWSFAASAAQATRFPTVQELYQAPLIGFGPNPDALDLGGFNPDLAPEQALDLQLTGRKTFAKAALTISLFRQEVEDALFQQTVPELATSLTTNIGEVITEGVEFVIATEDWPISGLSIDANVSLLDADITDNPLNPNLVGNRFPRIPDQRANASIRYAPTENWLFAAGWRYQSDTDRNIENTSSSVCDTFFCVSEFSFVDVKATRRFGDVAVSLGVDNITDERAFVFHPYPGRTVLLDVRWTGGL